MEAVYRYAEIACSISSTAQIVIEICLILFLLWVIRKGPVRHEAGSVDTARPEVSEEEKARRLAEFTPKPLVRPPPLDHHTRTPRVISGRVGKRVTINGRDLLNLATHDYLGLSGREDTTANVANDALRTYGVGTCGPRAFFGTTDVHLAVEESLARFFGVEEACLYSSAFAAISSAIPSYSKPDDVIFADEQVHFAIQQGILASRSTVHYFKHNDSHDLERLLKQQDELDCGEADRCVRRFLVLEGIYYNTGTLVNLPAMIRLRSRYKCRLIIDETLSFGVLGPRGKGVREHFGVPNSEFDLTSASLEHAMSAYGGFLCGSQFVIDHQRLSGLGYIFSASLPPVQGVITRSHLDLISRHPEHVQNLRRNCLIMHDLLANMTKLTTQSHPLSPVKHLRLSEPASAEGDKFAHEKLHRIVAYAEDHGVALSLARYIDDKELLQRPATIRLTVNGLLFPDEMQEAVRVINDACQKRLLL